MNMLKEFKVYILCLVIIVAGIGLTVGMAAKKEAELHQRKYTPAPENNSMMTFMIVILFMSVSWPSAMTVYWVISSLVSIIKTLLTNAVMSKPNKEAF